MSICGYNGTIGRGLELLIEGMALELKNKVTPSNSSLKVIQRELIEISVLTEEMQKTHGSTEIEMFIGLNLLAKSLFHNASEKLSDKSTEDDLVDSCNDIGKKFISILESTENYSESIKKRYFCVQ